MSYLNFNAPSDHVPASDKLLESFFTYNQATVGTGIALNADPVEVSATEAALIVDNSGSVTGGDNQRVTIDYIRLICTVAGTGATKARLAFYMDNIARYSSGGSELTGKSTSYFASPGYADRTPKSKVYFGDLTATAESNAKHICTRLIKNDTVAAPCFTVDDVFTLNTDADSGIGLNVVDGSNRVDSLFHIPPMTIGPGCSIIMVPVFPGQSAAASFEIEVGIIEHFHPSSV